MPVCPGLVKPRHHYRLQASPCFQLTLEKVKSSQIMDNVGASGLVAEEQKLWIN